MGLEHSRTANIGTSARALELSCRGAVRGCAVCRRRPGRYLKFNNFWTIELRARLVTVCHPSRRRDDLPFRLISGLVDSDRFHDGGINFPAVWTQPDFSGVLPKGTPVAQCFAVPRTAPQLEFESFDEAHREAYSKTVGDVLAAPNVYRKHFRARRGRA